MSAPSVIKNRAGFKRQKVRKGTFSCWECKNRKIRCEYMSSNNTVCKSCQQRGLNCISQTYVAVEGHESDTVNRRIDNVETMISQLLKATGKTKDSFNGKVQDRRYGVGNQTTSPSDGMKTICGHPIFNSDDSNSSAPSFNSPNQRRLNECLSLSRYLHSVMPTAAVTMMIFAQANYMQMPFQMFCRLRNTSNSADMDEQSPLLRASRKPPPISHPVMFAKKLYEIALCMQQLDPATFYETKNGLKEPVRDASKRLVKIAIEHVTSHDTLIKSLDGIETLMLESGYQFRVGDHHAAWLTLRRAMGLAELMGMRKIKHGDDGAESLWYLLNYSDRFVSAILGLPCSNADGSFASESALAGKSVVERLGRVQVALLGRIIDRNMKMQSWSQHGYAENELHAIYEQTRGIDCDLRQSANILPVDSWAVPNLSGSATDKDISKRTAILQVQMHHYYLLLLLHQPYLLRKSCVSSERMHGLVDYRYSKLATLSASRDLLDRFLILRDIHHGAAYRGLDHKAWLASATLLLAHIDAYQVPCSDSLEHQRSRDLVMVHRLVDRFRKAAYRLENVQQICTLLEMEANAANGERYYFSWSENNESARVPDSLRLSIPYFGAISVLSANPEMPQSWNKSTDLPLTELMASDLAEYESSQDNGFLRSNILAHSSIMSTDSFQTQNLEYLSVLDTALLHDRTNDLNSEPDLALQNPLESDGDAGLLSKMYWTQSEL